MPGQTTQSDDEYKAHLSGFERKMAEDDFGSDDLRQIFNERLVLVLSELADPTDDQTEEDRETIRKLIKSYLNDKRTIILAVMDARNNFANQEVFSMALAADPAGVRTVGIITKCDALEPGDEDRVLKIARNEDERLTHDGMTIDGRHKREKEFFSTVSPWNTLQTDRVGIKQLKVFLGQLLYAHIRGEFPGVVKDIEEFLRNARRELEQLGPSRQTAPDQRRYVTQIAAKYERVAAMILL
ncbi:hypothetical protein Asppvi_005228 [Aspergillus pseudoviridinutans]|uniref:P-loop containing nucleoside triphosphate hydrolase protein n=1 Tax=Aspergillus pseudoviridinutans TaxID=1517512 RepID=A0A9P3B7W3_9EURO|nr:uncharacterized protein Asppvi_005228 [Aspergillus pseudoviridinutans]GIJ86341.1 hypothetical protein Asppvi_005228 [Aspergillus pseudoviridinutans]